MSKRYECIYSGLMVHVYDWTTGFELDLDDCAEELNYHSGERERLKGVETAARALIDNIKTKYAEDVKDGKFLFKCPLLHRLNESLSQ